MPGEDADEIGQLNILADEKQMLLSELKILSSATNADVASKQLLNTIMAGMKSDPLCSKQAEPSRWAVESSGCCIVN